MKSSFLANAFYFPAVLASILVGGWLSSSTAQNLYTVETKPPRGFMPTADQLSSPLDSIDPVSGKVHLQIPLASLPQGRAGFGFDVDLVYDSHLYDMIPGTYQYYPNYPNSEPSSIGAKYDLGQVNMNGGWSYNFQNYRLQSEQREGVLLTDACTDPDEARAYRFYIGLPDGSLHLLHLKPPTTSGIWYLGYQGDGFFGITPSGTTSDCGRKFGWPAQTTGWLTYYTSDGSFLRLEVFADGLSCQSGGTPLPGDWECKQWRLYFPDGRRVFGAGSKVKELYDANDNKITFTNYYDEYGLLSTVIHHCRLVSGAYQCDGYNREIEVLYNVERATGPDVTQKEDRVSVMGPLGRITWTINWGVVRVGGDPNDPRYYLRYVDGCGQDPGCQGNQLALLDAFHWIVSSVQLPNGDGGPLGSYSFDYSDNRDDGYGELRSMTAPTGARYDYRYRLEVENVVCNPQSLTQCTIAENIAHYNSVREKTIQHDGLDPSDLHWVYNVDRYAAKTIITNPDGGTSVYWFNPSWLGYNIGNVVYRIDKPNGAVQKRSWAQNKVWHLRNTANPNNPYVEREAVTLEHAANTPSRTAVTAYSYDKNGNELVRTEYDWVDYNSSTSVAETGSVVARKTTTRYYVLAQDAANSQNDLNAYWEILVGSQSGGTRRLNAVRRRDVGHASAVFSVTEYNYDDPVAKGNVTAETRWDAAQSAANAPNPLPSNASKTWIRSYDPDGAGNLTAIIEPADNGEPVRETRITYDTEGYFPKQVDYGYGTATKRSWEYNWNADAGVINSKKDLDNSITTIYTYDAVGRLKSADEAGMRLTQKAYDDANRKITVKRDLRNHNDGLLQTITHYDQLGRVRLVRTSDGIPLSTNAETDGLKVKTSYRMMAGVGACVVSSTPYRTLNYTHPTIEPTLEWKRMLSDQSGRTTSISMFKGSEPDCQTIQSRTGETRTQYDIDYEYLSGVSRIRVTDPAGKIRDEERDALGRLVRVVEAPTIPALNYPTLYLYDPLDNLTQVNQGTQTRSFAYTTLGRLRSATNPESGTITYDYYASGDLMRRTQAGIESSFAYDELHRILRKTYSGGLTPQVDYDYYRTGSSSSPNIGQAKSVTNSVASTVYNGYDALGHVLSTTQTIYGTPNMSYTFNYPDWWLNDTTKSMQYPSGKMVQYEVDDAGRIRRVSAGTKLYADLPASANPYTADGRITRMMLGNDLWETRDYQTPGTPTLFKLGTSSGANDKLEIEYNYDGAQNNGNVIRQVIRQAGKTWVQKYSYDDLNRLDCGWEGIVDNEPPDNTCQPGQMNKWSQAYGYDRYGNRWIDSTRTGGLQGVDIHEPTANVFNPDNNRINNLGYDSAGNLQQYEPRTLAYDAENRLISATSASNGSAFFYYDGDGRRIRKVWTAGGGTPQATLYVYDVAGRLAVEYSTQTAVSGTIYPVTDVLGSVRAVSGDEPPAGTAAIVECYDYLPFGRLLRSDDNGRTTGCYPANPDYALSSRLPQKFTGKERDETGLDYFGARFYSGAQGRFTSPDPSRLSAFIDNPQTWNQYSYVYNNPMVFVDRNGQWPRWIHEKIIDQAFPGLTADQRQILKDVSAHLDDPFAGGQFNGVSFQHAMRSPLQLPENAQANYAAFVSNHLDRATKIQVNFWEQNNTGLSNDALKEFGLALHAILDSTSPAHAGFQVWNVWNPIQAAVHAYDERNIRPKQLESASQVSERIFNRTFNNQLFNPFDLLELLSRQGTSTSVCLVFDDQRVCQ